MSDYASEYGRAIHYSSSMVTEADFHRHIHAEPEDDVHSLAYADWLEENGKPGHAEMIRKSFVPREQYGGKYPGVDLHPVLGGDSHLEPGKSRISVTGDGEGGFFAQLNIRSVRKPDELVYHARGLTSHEARDISERLVSEGSAPTYNTLYNFPHLRRGRE